MVQILFTDYGSSPIPHPPRDASGGEFEPDGDSLLSVDQSVVRFGIASHTLRQIYSDAIGPYLTETDAEAMKIVRPAPQVDKPQRRVLSAGDVQMLAEAGLLPAVERDRVHFLAMCERSGCDPLRRQIYWRYRRDHLRKKTVFSVELKIDGLRAIAQRSGEFEAAVGPRWSADGEKWLKGWPGAAPPPLARFKVKRRGREGYAEATTNWESYRVMHLMEDTGEEVLDDFWRKMPDLMLAKCAEAGAFRRAFPELLSGLYIEEELDQMENPPKRDGDLPDGAGPATDGSQLPPAADADSQLDVPPAAAPSSRAVVPMSDETLAHKLTLLGLSDDDRELCITHFAGKYPKLYAETRDNFNNQVFKMVRASPRKWTGRKMKLVAQ